jgi:hypothetical protein
MAIPETILMSKHLNVIFRKNGPEPLWPVPL